MTFIAGSKTGKFTDVSVSAEISPAGVVELVKETNVTFQVVFTVSKYSFVVKEGVAQET